MKDISDVTHSLGNVVLQEPKLCHKYFTSYHSLEITLTQFRQQVSLHSKEHYS